MIPDVRSVLSFKANNQTYLAVANYNETAKSGYNIFEIRFVQSPVPQLIPSIPEIISRLLAKMTIELEQVRIIN